MLLFMPLMGPFHQPIFPNVKTSHYLTSNNFFFSKLRKNGLVTSVRGPGGGYRLGRCSAQISIVDVIGAVDESINATRCEGKADCQGGSKCLTHSLWSDLSERIEGFLQAISLAELVSQGDIKTVAKRQDRLHEMNQATQNRETLITTKSVMNDW